MLASVMPGVVSASFRRDLTFFTCIPAAVTAVTLPLFTSAKTSTFFPVVWILCLPFFLILSASRSFPLRWCFSFAKAMRDASIVVTAAIIPSARRRLIMNLLPLEKALRPQRRQDFLQALQPSQLCHFELNPNERAEHRKVPK